MKKGLISGEIKKRLLSVNGVFLPENGGCFLQGVLSWKGSCYLDKRVSFPNNWAQSSGHGTLMNISPKPVNILLALGCKTVDALAYYAGVAAEIDLKLKLEQVFDR